MAEQYTGTVDKKSIMTLDWGGNSTNDALTGKLILDGLKDFLKNVPTYSAIVGKNIYMFASEEDYTAWITDGSLATDSRIISKSPAIKGSDLLKSGTLEATWTAFPSKIISGDTCVLSGLKFTARTYDDNEVLNVTTERISYKITAEDADGNVSTVADSSINSGSTVKNISLYKYLVSSETVSFTITASFTVSGLEVTYSSDPIDLIKSSLSLSFSDNTFWKDRITPGSTYNINFKALGSGDLTAHADFYVLGESTPKYTYTNATLFIGGANKANTFNFSETDTRVIEEGIYTAKFYLTTELGGETVSTQPISKNVMVAATNSSKDLVCVNLSTDTLTNYTSAEVLQFTYNTAGGFEEVTASISATYSGATYTTNASKIAVSGLSAIYTYSTTVALNVVSNKEPLSGKVTISAGEYSYKYPITITNEYQFSATSGSTFDFDPTAQNTKSDIYDSISTKTITTTWSGITWGDNEGYITNSDGNTVLKLFADSSALIKKSLFSDVTNGMTFEIMYRVTNVLDTETPIISCFNSTSGSSYNGLKIYAEDVDFRPAVLEDSARDNSLLRMCSDEVIHLVITYYPDYSGWGFPLTKMFVNGKIAREVNGSMVSISGNSTNTNGYLTIGSSAADLEIYRMRFYPNSIDDEQVLANYYNVTLDTDQRIEDNTRNKIFADGEIQFNNIYQKGTDAAGNKRALFNCFVLSAWDEYDEGVKPYAFPSNGSLSKDELTNVYDASVSKSTDISQEISDMVEAKQCVLPGFTNGTKSFECLKARIEIFWDNDKYAQNTDVVIELDPDAAVANGDSASDGALKYLGSSSTNYFRYNWRSKFEKGSKIWTAADYYDTSLTDEEKAAKADDGGKLIWYQDQTITTDANGVTTIVGSNPVKFGVLTAKKNAASSMLTHKAGFDNLYNELYREYMGDDASYCFKLESYHRVSAYAAPFLGFVKIPVDKNNPDSGYNYRFVGLYTMGNDKGDKTTTGFDNKEWCDIYEVEGAEQAPKFTNFTIPWNDNKLENTVSALGELITDTDEETTVSKEQWEVIKYPKSIKDDVDLNEDTATEALLLKCRLTQLSCFHDNFKPMYDFVWEHSINILPYEGSVDDLKKGYYPEEFTLGDYYKDLLAMAAAPTSTTATGAKNALNAYFMYWSVQDPTHTLYYRDGANDAYVLAVETDMDYKTKEPTTVHLEYQKARHQSYTVSKTVVTVAEQLYTSAEADALNNSHLISDANGVAVGEDGYVTTYEEGYVAIDEGDVKVAELTKEVINWMVVKMPALSLAELDKIAAGNIDLVDFTSKGTYTLIDVESDATHEPYVDETSKTWFVYNINTEAFEDSTLNGEYYANSVIAETEYQTINEKMRTMRALDFKDNWGTYFNTKDLLLWYTDVVLNAGTDERAKNTYWYKLGGTKKYKTGEKDEKGKAIYAKDPNYVPDLKWRMRIDDTDTRFDVDNTGLCVNKYWIEPLDNSVLSGQLWSPNSTFFNLLGHEVFTKPTETSTYDYYNVQGAFYYRFKAMSKLATGSDTLTSSQVLSCYDKYMFNIADYFPQQAYNQDATFTYEQAKRWIIADSKTHSLTTGTDPINQCLGDHKLGDRGFIKNRIIYYMSKYALGDFNKDQGGTGVVVPRGVNAGGVTVDLTFNRWMYYVTYGAEHALPLGTRLAVNTTYSFANFLQLANADSGLYGASYISSLGDWSLMYWDSTQGATVDFYPFNRVRELNLGNAAGVKFNRSVRFLNDSNTSGLSALRVFNIENCNTIGGSHDLTLSTHLKEVNAFGSNITGLKLAKGTPVNKLYLPKTITSILLNNLEELTDFKVEDAINDGTSYLESLYTQVSGLLVRNTPAVDGLQLLMDMFKLSESKDIALRNIWVEGFDNTFDTTNVQSNLDLLMHIADVDDEGDTLYAGFDGTTYDAKGGTSPTLKGTITINANYRQNDINNIKAALANPTDLNIVIQGQLHVALADFNDPILQAAIYNWVSTKSTGSDLSYYTNEILADEFIALTKDPNSKYLIYKLLSASNINTWLNTSNSSTTWTGTVTNWLGASDGKAVSVAQENLRDLSDWSTWFPNSYPSFIAGSSGHKIPATAKVPINIEYTNKGTVSMLGFLAADSTGNYGLGTVNIVANKGLTLSAYTLNITGNTSRLVIDTLITDINGDFSINTLFRTAKITNWYINTPSSTTCPELTDSGFWSNITNIYVNLKLYWDYLTGETWQGRLTSQGLNFIPYDFDKELVVDVPTNTTFTYDTSALLFNLTAVNCSDFILTSNSIFEIKFNTCVYQSSSAHKVYIFGNSYCYVWINTDGKIEVQHQLNGGSYYKATGPALEDLGTETNITLRYNCANKVLTVNGIDYTSENTDATATTGASVAIGTINSTVSASEWTPAHSIFIGHVFYVIHWNVYAQLPYLFNFLTPGKETDTAGNIKAVYLAETDTEHRYKSVTSLTDHYSASTGSLVFIGANTMESYSY